MDGFAERYRMRWGIETWYRCYEGVRPRTASRNESVRILLMFFPFLLYNAWILAGYLLARRWPGRRRALTLRQTVRILARLCRESIRRGRPPDPK